MSIATPLSAGRLALSAILILCVALLAGLGFGAKDAGAVSTLSIYSNPMRSTDAANQIRQFGSKAKCSRAGSTKSLRVKVGKQTRECFFNVPVVGRDLQASITARLFKQTPKKVARRTWVAVSVRQASDGSRYQFAVLPQTSRYSLRKITPDGKTKYLAHGIEKKAIRPLAAANRITLRAFNGVGKLPASTARVVAMVNGKRIALVDDAHGNELLGRDTTISIGSKQGANGAYGSFVSANVSMPDPF